MSIKRYGLVFKMDDQCYLAQYHEDGTMEDASPIEDDNGVYAELNPRELSLVDIEYDGETENGELLSLSDLKTVTIRNEESPDDTIEDLLVSGNFPALAEGIYREEIENGA